MILVTGGAGFIGLNFIQGLLQYTDETQIVNLDKLTYASNKAYLPTSDRHLFVYGDINNSKLVDILVSKRPTALVHFAAESHVDNSIAGPAKFITTNINGTYTLLESVRKHSPETLFFHISTDEVFGSLSEEEPGFTETSQYKPNSPYSSSKAASDHLVRAWHETYELKTIITNCSNNYGLYQYPEKLIPLTITRALNEKSIPVYGDGRQIRDWIHVEDHCSAIRFLIKNGTPGQSYNIGSRNELPNIEIVHKLCQILDEEKPRHNGRSYVELIEFVEDRPGHDRRYAINSSKINNLGWYPKKDFNSELRNLVRSIINARP